MKFLEDVSPLTSQLLHFTVCFCCNFMKCGMACSLTRPATSTMTEMDVVFVVLYFCYIKLVDLHSVNFLRASQTLDCVVLLMLLFTILIRQK